MPRTITLELDEPDYDAVQKAMAKHTSVCPRCGDRIISWLQTMCDDCWTAREEAKANEMTTQTAPAKKHNLNFEPAPRTRGGYEYEILGTLSEPCDTKYPIVGQIKHNGKWSYRSWTQDGFQAIGSKGDADLIPAETHRWGAVYEDVYKHTTGDKLVISWRDKPIQKRECAAGCLFILHEIRCGDRVRYEIVGDE